MAKNLGELNHFLDNTQNGSDHELYHLHNQTNPQIFLGFQGFHVFLGDQSQPQL
jgi:hypothetical protein